MLCLLVIVVATSPFIARLARAATASTMADARMYAGASSTPSESTSALGINAYSDAVHSTSGSSQCHGQQGCVDDAAAELPFSDAAFRRLFTAQAKELMSRMQLHPFIADQVYPRVRALSELQRGVQLDKGHFGVVFVYEDSVSKVQYAGKQLFQVDARVEFAREAALLAIVHAIGRQDIVSGDTVAIDETSSHWVLLMQYYPGHRLLNVLASAREEGSMFRLPMLHWLRCLADQLDFLHAWRLFHNDLALRNILVDTRTGTLTLIDLGASRVQQAAETKFPPHSDELVYVHQQQEACGAGAHAQSLSLGRFTSQTPLHARTTHSQQLDVHQFIQLVKIILQPASNGTRSLNSTVSSLLHILKRWLEAQPLSDVTFQRISQFLGNWSYFPLAHADQRILFPAAEAHVRLAKGLVGMEQLSLEEGHQLARDMWRNFTPEARPVSRARRQSCLALPIRAVPTPSYRLSMQVSPPTTGTQRGARRNQTSASGRWLSECWNCGSQLASSSSLPRVHLPSR